MKNFTIYLILFFFLVVSKVIGQETFESEAKRIANKIEKITKEEKEALKEEIEAINVQLSEGKITQEQADKRKKELAEARAVIIEEKVTLAQNELNDLVQKKVDGKIKEDSSKVYMIRWKSPKRDKDSIHGEKRTTSQFVFAMGLNNTMVDGKLQDSNYSFIGSHFYEWGFTYNSRLMKNDNLLHAKYGLSLMYNNIRPTNNRTFVVNGDQTNLEVNSIHLTESRFRNVYLAVPVHLEFDFTRPIEKNGKTYFKTHKSFRFGVGGYAGINVKSKQILKFEEDDLKYKTRIKGDYNVNNFIYGLSSYIGYRDVSLYFKYDLNPLFQDNLVKENNISLGLRLDLN
ncbi:MULTISPECIES: hypothetical protein [Flavobacterium]|jgi:hypothetical protein|uniref:Outer membrane protein beta-barrel domain-containing protein n=1 Tax=Flavobacterium johnsoniae (strain ATCC 17061 / DSM 2064 / JCM 8514 / BCRC 14874 / CCUG 350202 / NBRC 14942 / NCIMB 11054 / UW101) TaxID=376686 RepID=A5FIZ8_FLAJ1|nr:MULTISPECIES: hypothetical protein [Flavobacterium]ABQ04821.1 hypothetical protein Fjoh_1789 [Flavobacterium johnsoniae UW101]OXG02977.1 hypothetical protein B0A63_01620 [Flavobacterium johnsoniae UW101]WDF60530.1 hypothetical protein PQ462_03965 [Flavobacterium sp. KACC 22758]WQG83381.1 hypothetical protein SR927_09755 [Flavobacterium johnsoniae UW101]SHK35260.1 Type II restriction endonuclease, TdeIII [Flavobacterium johnsoniae]